MAKRRIITCVLLITTLLLGGMAQAQQAADTSSLIVGGAQGYGNYLDTDLYRLDPATNQLVALTHDGYKSSYALSPDGTKIAYLIAPAVARAESANGNPDLIGVVWDIEVYEIASGQRTRIAAQPDDAKVTAGQISDGRARSAPVWSPDSSALAWTEQDDPASGSPSLMIYSFADGKTAALDDSLPEMPQSASGFPTNLAWGQPGIAVFTNDPASDGTLTGSIRLYDPQNGLLHTYLVNTVLDDNQIAAPPRDGPFWLQDQSDELLLIELANGRWYGVNLTSGSVDAFEHNIELVSAANPDSSLKAEGAQGDSAVLAWSLPDFNGADCDQVAMDPAGDALACWSDASDSLSIWQDGAQRSLDSAGLTQNISLMWGAIQWRVHRDLLDATDDSAAP